MSALTFCRGKEDCLINKNWKKMCDRNLLIGEMIIYDELERVVTFCLERISLRDFSFLEEDRRGWKILADSQRYDKIGFVIIRVYGIRIKAASFLIEIIFLSERNKMTKVMVVNVNQLSYFVIYQRFFIVQWKIHFGRKIIALLNALSLGSYYSLYSFR